MKQYYILVMILLLHSPEVISQNFINGSFEDTTATTCLFNLSNSTFNSFMENVHAFGTAEEVDIKFLALQCFIPSIPDGDVAITLHQQSTGNFDAVSIELDTPLISGNAYNISFKAHGNTLSTSDVGTLLIGCSTANNDFDSSILYSASLVADVWTEFTFDFIAPNDATYITVFPDTSIPGVPWSDIDDFKISTELSINENENNKSIKVYPNPADDFVRVSGVPSIVNYKITNAFGQNVLSGTISEHNKIPTSSLRNGIYFLIIENNTTIKFIKK